MPATREIGRYQIEYPPIGQGGMGIVYKAKDRQYDRYVALKTLKGTADPEALELFQKERNILKEICHPNIVDILDIGELTENGESKPFFVMPFLRGKTFDKLIKSPGSALMPERVVEIMAQVCRGLQAAHDERIIHRDLKPSNLFVLSDDSIKIIDFGIVHLADSESRTGIKGTLPYMAPEQLDLKPASAKSDIFSLGVVCYEALTGRKPFDRPTMEETMEAIRRQMPTPVSDLNSAVNEQVSRVVQKALAKQPYHRFATAREFGESLQRALRNELGDLFDGSRIQPRLKSVRKKLESGDYNLAIDILNELESEGNIHSEIPMLRMEAERAMRSKAVEQLLEDARTRLEEEEYPLALQKVQSVLDIESDNIDALAMKSDIERKRSAAQIERWQQIARQHIDNRLFQKARQAVEEIARIDPSRSGVKEMLAEISEQEGKVSKARQEKQLLFDSAHKAFSNGELSSALRLLERVISLGKNAPGHPNTDARYLEFYEQVRREHDEFASAYADAKRAVSAGDFDGALEICNRILTRRPREPLIQALKIEVEDQKRQQNSAAIANLHSQIEGEEDLDRKLQKLKTAVKQFPGEQAFAQSLKVFEARRNLVNDIARRARHYESQGQFIEASSQWETLRTIYKQYPGLEYEIQRLGKKQEGYLNNQAKAKLIDKIDHALFEGEYQDASELLTEALAESPEDEDLLRLKQQSEGGAEQSRRARAFLEDAEQLAASGDHLLAIEKLRTARQLGPNNPRIASVLNSVLLECARSLAERDWRAALPFLEEAQDLNPEDPGVAGVSQLVSDARLRERIDQCVARARDLREQGKVDDAIGEVEAMLRENPNDARLLQARTHLRALQRQAADHDKTIDVTEAPERAKAAGVGAASGQREPPASASGFFPVSKLDPLLMPEKRRPEDASVISGASTGVPTPSAAEPSSRSSYDSFDFEEKRFWNRNRALGLIALVVVASAGVTIGAMAWFAPTPRPKQITTMAPAPSPQTEPAPPATAPKSEAAATGPQATAPPIVDQKPPEPNTEPNIPAVAKAGTEGGTPATANGPKMVAPSQPAMPAASKGQVAFHFSSEPGSAQVKVDNNDELSCSTPCELDLAKGRHIFVLSANGFADVRGVIQVPDERGKFVVLAADQKAVRVVSVPSNLAIVVDGKPRGETPTTLRLSMGEHKLKLSGDSVEEHVIKVTDEDFQIVTIKIGDGSTAVSGPR